MNNNHNIEPAEFHSPGTIKPADFTPSRQSASRLKKFRYGMLFTAAAAVACITVIWFVFTARSVYIEVDPGQATIEITGGFSVKLADRYLMRQGTYQVTVSYPRYYPFSVELIVSEEQNQMFSYALQRLPGHLNVTAASNTGAEIWIDGEFRGYSPAQVRNLTHGSHMLEIIADRYLPFSSEVIIEGLDQEQDFEAQLVPAWSDVSFTSSPPGAEVWVNEEAVGSTPLTTDILQGDHAVRIKLAGFKAWTERLSINPNESIVIPLIELVPADAIVFLESVPARANVTVDGVFTGQTPLEVALSPGDTVAVRFFREGYQSASRQVTASLDEEKRLRVILDPELAEVSFNVIPADADLYIDGIFRGRAAQSIQLTTQKHDIEIRKSGYVDYKASLTPRTGIEQRVDVSLKTLQQAKLEAIKPVIRTAAGQDMKLFYPSGFTMGASRREAGRRSNESLRNVELNRPFYLSLKEVTNREFREFDPSHSSGEVKGNSLNADMQPVVNLGWDKAARYCNWLSKKDSLTPFYIESDGRIKGFNMTADGYRLPTEAEWAWTARVVGRAQVLKFPWGEDMPPEKASGNYADDSAAHLLGRIVSGYNDGHAVTAPVGSFKANSKGVFDLGGNASEWIHDFYDIAISAGNRTEVNPMGPENGEFHVIRGSSWAHGSITELRLSYRDYSAEPRDDVGFRIARFLE